MPKKPTLFDEVEPDDEASSHLELPPGLQYVPGFINVRQERRLLELIDGNEWLEELKRRVQHYGYKYDYRGGPLTPLGKLPQWAQYLGKKFVETGYMKQVPDQLIVNEYEPGQGISAHVDREDQFDDTVISVSLGSTAMMDFIHLDTKRKVSLLLEPMSLVVMGGEARHEWTHAIPGRLTDEWKGERIRRERRVSLTFRNTLQSGA